MLETAMAGVSDRDPAADRLTRGAPNGAAAVAEGLRASDVSWTRASQIAVIVLAVIAVLWCAYVSQPVLVPVLLAWTIATVVEPMVKALRDLGVPRALASIGVSLAVLLVIGGLLFLLSAPLAYWLGRLTYIGALIKEKLESFSQPLAFLQELQKGFSAIGSGGSPALKVEQQSSGFVSGQPLHPLRRRLGLLPRLSGQAAQRAGLLLERQGRAPDDTAGPQRYRREHDDLF